MIEYKTFISGREFNGTIGDLIEEIIEAFVNEEIGQSKLGEFHSMAGIVTLEDYVTFEEYGDHVFNEGLQGLGEDYILKEDVIRDVITSDRLLCRIKFDNHKLRNDSKVKATYTLGYI